MGSALRYSLSKRVELIELYKCGVVRGSSFDSQCVVVRNVGAQGVSVISRQSIS